MSSSSWTHEIESPASAGRLFRALCNWTTLGPKLLPEVIISATIDGDGSTVGSVKQFNFSPAMSIGFLRERIDFIDIEGFEITQSIEGGFLEKKVEQPTSVSKVEPTADGGCVYKVLYTYNPLPGAGAVSDDEIAKSKEMITGIIKVAGAYLLANPDAYA